MMMFFCVGIYSSITRSVEIIYVSPSIYGVASPASVTPLIYGIVRCVIEWFRRSDVSFFLQRTWLTRSVTIKKGSHASMWRKQLKQIEHLCSNQNNEEFIERVLNHALEQLMKPTKPTISTKPTILLTIIVITVLVTFSSIFYDTTIQWLNFDDYTNFRDNEHVKDGFSAASSRWAFENGVVLGVYEPLSLHFKMLIFQFFSEARYFLCVSVIVHILNTISIYRLSRTMFPDVSERFHLISTLFWSVHPLRVEVVAWASAQPYLLCTFCGIWSMYYAEQNWYWMSLFLFACSSLFKSASISLVFALAAWRFRKGKSLTSLIPHAIMCCLLVMKTLSIKEGAALLRELTLLDRVYVS